VRRLLPDAKITLSMDDSQIAAGASFAFELNGDSSRATNDFGFEPRHKMETGVYKTLNGNRIYAGLPPIPEPEDAAAG
jgi:hypothetical protein